MIGTLGGLLLGGGMIGSQLFGAKKQADAAKQASQQQQQAANQALDLQRQMYQTSRGDVAPIYQQTRADLAPYMQQGGQGLTALSSLLGVPQVPGPRPPVGMPGAPISGGIGGPLAGVLMPGGPMSGGAPMPGAGGGTVMLRAPTGQTQAVPADQVAFYLSRGATRV